MCYLSPNHHSSVITTVSLTCRLLHLPAKPYCTARMIALPLPLPYLPIFGLPPSIHIPFSHSAAIILSPIFISFILLSSSNLLSPSTTAQLHGPSHRIPVSIIVAEKGVGKIGRENNSQGKVSISGPIRQLVLHQDKTSSICRFLPLTPRILQIHHRPAPARSRYTIACVSCQLSPQHHDNIQAGADHGPFSGRRLLRSGQLHQL